MKLLNQKTIMALTGLFLCFFLIIHLIGNLQLLLPAEVAQTQYNMYSQFLSGNILIKLISFVLYFCILAHIYFSLSLTLKSKKAQNAKYHYDKRRRASSWQSRNMLFLGFIILLFLILHFKDYWYLYKFGNLPFDVNGNKDLYSIVMISFEQWWYVLIYEIAFLALAFHLLHGVFSAHRTLGLYNPNYARIIKIIGSVFTIIISLGFMLIPLIIYFRH